MSFLVRKPLFKKMSIYVLGSIGPLITDTETERMSSGFSFADVVAMGISNKINRFTIDFRPSLRHVFNAGIQSKNSGYNTKNIEFGIYYPL
ncbi:acyloxyacyl hydrolase [Flavobacterium agrisoli]|uniref:acyloxyacyl hydrolase n=1 Tax=Flavobacterium agrisoli TaxID=2793066 RepID=UPI00293D9A8B|nr:acyloxyacyl hydrolase [Flavobacterium agrisoli]